MTTHTHQQIHNACNYDYLKINNTVIQIQSTLSLTGYRVFSMFDPFRPFHSSLPESVAVNTFPPIINWQFAFLLSHRMPIPKFICFSCKEWLLKS